jgi:hypothetical protein
VQGCQQPGHPVPEPLVRQRVLVGQYRRGLAAAPLVSRSTAPNCRVVDGIRKKQIPGHARVWASWPAADAAVERGSCGTCWSDPGRRVSMSQRIYDYIRTLRLGTTRR